MNTTMTAAAEKTLTDRNGKEIKRGTIVRVGEGWMEVRSVYTGNQTVNLGPIFHANVTRKRVPLAEVFEDYDAWYDTWSKSEAYRCM